MTELFIPTYAETRGGLAAGRLKVAIGAQIDSGLGERVPAWFRLLGNAHRFEPLKPDLDAVIRSIPGLGNHVSVDPQWIFLELSKNRVMYNQYGLLGADYDKVLESYCLDVNHEMPRAEYVIKSWHGQTSQTQKLDKIPDGRHTELVLQMVRNAGPVS